MPLESGTTLEDFFFFIKHKPEVLLLINWERVPPSVCPLDTHLHVAQDQMPFGKPDIVKNLFLDPLLHAG